MLAYLDDVLDPAEAQRLGAKIEESEFASKLVQRIRTISRKARLGAPKVDGRGIASDANPVAEYLDGSLAQDRVPDFEKVCLESDMHLAEVAACHQILTLVLGEPAQTSPELRDRVYEIGKASPRTVPQAAPPTSAPAPATPPSGKAPTNNPPTPAAMTTAPATTPQPEPQPQSSPSPTLTAEEEAAREFEDRPQRAKPEVPDYLRESKGTNFLPYILTLGLLFVSTLVALAAMGSFDADHPLVKLFRGEETPEVAPEDPQAGDPTDPAATPGDPPATPAAPATDTPAAGTTPGETPSGLRQPDIDPARTPSPTDPVAPAPMDDPAATPPATTPPAPDPSTPTPTPTPPATPPTTTPGTPPPGTEPPLDIPDTPAPPKLEPKPAGSLTSAAQVLAASLPTPEGPLVWKRLSDGAEVHTLIELLAPPAFRPQISLKSNVTLDLLGPTRFFFTSPTPDTHEINFLAGGSGRAVIKSGDTPSSIRLALLEHRGVIRLLEPGASVAIEVVRIREPGVNPEKGPIHILAQLHSLTGRVAWEEKGKLTPLEQGDSITMFNAASVVNKAQPGAEPPSWIDPINDNPSERRAATMLGQNIGTDKSFVLALVEQTDLRQVEVVALAIRALCEVDYYEPLVKALGDPNLKSHWAGMYDAAEIALARSLESAQEMKKSLAQANPEIGPTLFELLVRYTPDALAGGAAAKLVNLLDSESMPVRVVASENLRRITGFSYGYRPDANAATNRGALQRWRDKLAKLEIAYPAESTTKEPMDSKPDDSPLPGATPPKPPGPKPPVKPPA